ncbi:MAG: AtpZ/AtpI family protein [Patescibacteria group bacterium]
MPSKTPSALPPLALALNIGWQITLPLVVLALLGRYLDSLFHTSPLLFLVGIIVAIIFSSWLVIRTVTRVIDSTADTPAPDNNTDTTIS